MTLNLGKTKAATAPPTMYAKWRARLSERFGENRPGRRDLESIVVNAIVLVIFVSVISATFFWVVPWAEAHVPWDQ